MGKITWEKVSFTEKQTPTTACILTFRPNGQIVFDVNTLAVLGYPRFVHLYASPANNLIALKATGNDDDNALQLTVTTLEQGQSRVIMARKVYAWLLSLLKQEEAMLIKLPGAPNEEGMVVFDLKDAGIKPKRTRKSKADADS